MCVYIIPNAVHVGHRAPMALVKRRMRRERMNIWQLQEYLDEYLAAARISIGGTANLVRKSVAPKKYLGHFLGSTDETMYVWHLEATMYL